MSNPILIFSHNYLVGEWETIVTEQLQLLLDTKLYQASTKIHYCVFAYENNAYKKFVNLVIQHDPLNKIQIIRHEENKFEFLALDHVNGGGREERKTRSTQQIALTAIREGFPDTYRVLCHNCNQAIGWYGKCPHENERTA